MTVRFRCFVAAAVGLWMAHPLPGQEPARLPVERGQTLAPRPELPANQQIANSIVERLRQSGQLKHYTIDVAVLNGTAELTGSVADQSQHDEALRLVQAVPGVERVFDRLTVNHLPDITRVQAEAGQAAPPRLAPAGEALQVPPAAATPNVPVPQLRQSAPTNGAAAAEPVPIFAAPMPSPYDLNPPKLPPYAWPTYAPYNNYSRVAHPLLYPYNAWPFIGPMYPFPKIPLGWRSVKLEWEDGHWWYKKVATKHCWWRVRYW